MINTTSHPFIGHKQTFEAIPLQKRDDYLRYMLAIRQKSGPHQIFKLAYPSSNTFLHEGHRLFYQYAAFAQKPKAILFYFHGLHSHSGASGYLGVQIAKFLPVHVFSLDFRNFGNSSGQQRGYLESIDDLVEQAEAFVSYILSKFQENPLVFLSGGSLGGAVSIKMQIRRPQVYSGLILFSPALREIKISQYYLKRVGVTLGYLFPRMKLLQQSQESGTKYEMEADIRADPGNYCGRWIAGSLRAALQAMTQTQKLMKQFSGNYLLIQSGVDKLVDPFAPIDFERECRSQDKTTIYCKDMWHSFYYEEQIEFIVPIVNNWLSIRL